MAHQNHPVLQNEPTCQNGTLSPLQLAAVRYLVAGHRPGYVARGLKIDRHTLLRWRRSPVFQDHINRLHLQLATPRPRVATQPRPPATPSAPRAGLTVDDILALGGYPPISAVPRRAPT